MAIEKRSQGFGDSIANISKLIKADIAAKKIAKELGLEDCGCSKRQERLNNPDLLINRVFYKNTDTDENIKE
jgi:hypothetical protein